MAINRLSIRTEVKSFRDPKQARHPEQGILVRGMFLQGAAWDERKHSLVESKPGMCILLHVQL